MPTKGKPMDASWVPFRAKQGFPDTLKECVKRVAFFAGLNLVLFWWQTAGYLADVAAVPAMWVCALLAGFSAGKCFRK